MVCHVLLSLAFLIQAQAADYRFYTDSGTQTNGLVGSYVNQSLRTQPPQPDWRTTYPISGTRIDADINFGTLTWGNLASVGLTGTYDPNFGWENYSVQWDGYIQILTNGVMLATQSDDSSRMWVDINQDGVFNSTGDEYANNHWGTGQDETVGTFTPALSVGIYRIRIQYQEDFFGSSMRVVSKRTGEYRDFSGNTHFFEELLGKYTRLLVSKEDLEKLSLPQAKELLDQQDILYAQLKELTGGEPVGEGLLTVAFVETCGAGCGSIGGKGVEIDPDFASAPVEVTYDFIAHEMTHNFDTLGNYFLVDPDTAHGWTAWIQNYLDVATQHGSGGRSPEKYQAFRVKELFTNPYLAVPGHAWNACVKSNGYCGGLASFLIQAGFCHKYSELHGVAAVQRALGFMRTAIANRGLTPATMSPEQRNDLMLESFSHGAQTNLTCYADSWNWTISPALRTRLATLYGSTNSLCADGDGDGYSFIQGDKNDANPAIHPGAIEALNGLDDDCNGIVDDLTVFEVAQFPSSPATSLGVTLPIRIIGQNNLDSDFFHLDVTNDCSLNVEIASLDSGIGWFQVYTAGGTLKYDAYVSPERVLMAAISLAPGHYEFHVGLSSGRYDMLLSLDSTWPPFEFAPAPQLVGSNLWSLKAAPLLAALTNRPDVTVRHWVSGQGWVATNNFVATNVSSISLSWAAPTNFPAQSATYRSQYFTNHIAATRLTEARAFQRTAVADRFSTGTNGFVIRFAGNRAAKAIQWESSDLVSWTASKTNQPFLNVWNTTNSSQLNRAFFRLELLDE